MKALILSVRPEHAIKIIKGKKTLELRKRVPKDYKGWVYVYVTKAIRDYKQSHYYQPKGKEDIFRLHGIIPCRFWFDEYEEVLTQHHIDSEQIERILKQVCIGHDDLDKYVGDKETIYAWHIKNVEIFDKPKQLSEFIKDWDIFDTDSNGKEVGKYIQIISYVTKAPHPYMYAWVKEEGK